MTEAAPFTVGRLIDCYRRESGEPRGREDHRHARWWHDRLGQDPVSALTGARICSALDQLASHGRSPSTVAFYLRFLRRVCAWGARCGYLPSDPCAGMALPTERTPALRVLSLEEERKLCAALGSPYSLWVRFAILTGLKQSEQFSLRWRDVDLQKAVLLTPHATTGALSQLPLSADALSILTQLRQTHPPSMWVFPDLKNPFRAVNVHAFYVGRWGDAVRRAGIPWCAWKDLRHTCGVRLAQSGTPIHAVTQRMRQRETRQAYVYRAWKEDGETQPRSSPPRQPVFAEFTQETLRTLMARDTTATPFTFKEVAQLYAVHHLRQRPSRLDFEQCYRQFWHPWADRLVSSLTKKEVVVWLWGLARTPGSGNKARTLLRGMFNWAKRLDLITCPNPAEDLPPFPASTRDRFLTIEELERFVNGLPTLSVKPRAYLLLLLLSGCRRGEALAMQWSDVDLIAQLWRKPNTKNGHSHLVPLPVQVVDALQQLPRVNEWVFPGQRDHHWSAASAEKVWGVVRRRFGLEGVRLHDLRRTAASYLAINGENLPTIQSVLNHRSLGPTSIYARLNTNATARALQTQADQFCRLTQDHKVLPFPSPSRQHEFTARALPPSAEAFETGDPDLDQLIWKTWARLSPTWQAQYVTAAASLGVPLEHLLWEAVEQRLRHLEQEYGLSPKENPAYALGHRETPNSHE